MPAAAGAMTPDRAAAAGGGSIAGAVAPAHSGWHTDPDDY